MTASVTNAALVIPRSPTHFLGEAVELAVGHGIQTQDARGAWEILPDARVFETALGAYALSQVNDDAARRAAARGREWARRATVQTHHPIAYCVESLLRNLLLDIDAGLDLNNPDFDDVVMSSRERLMYALALHAGRRIRSRFDEATFRQRVAVEFKRGFSERLKQWSMADMAAVHAILEARHGNFAAVNEACQYLMSVQQVDGSLFNNPVSTCMALIALNIGAPESQALRRCMNYVLSTQHSDGTWRFCTSDVWDTTLMVRAFRRHPLFAKHSLHRALEFLRSWQNPDGGWPFRSGAESDNDTTASVLLSFFGHSAYSTSVTGGLDYIARGQMPNGLWRTWHYKLDPPVEDTIAHILAALNRFQDWHLIHSQASRHWLEERFNQRGRWTASWYYSLPYAVLEVKRALGINHPAMVRSFEQLIELQNADGGWGQEIGQSSIPSATGLAIAALVDYLPVESPVILRGLSYLLETQRPDGTWEGRPEMFGPRPLISHYQTHTQSFVAMGLMAAWSKIYE